MLRFINYLFFLLCFFYFNNTYALNSNWGGINEAEVRIISPFSKSGDNKKIYLYDSTLRDGAQTKGVDFSLSDKIAIAKMLDDLGIDYIEGGWPGANNTDTEFFKNSPKDKSKNLFSFIFSA